MKKVILYGAGKRGKNVAELLKQKGIMIEGFLDTAKTGETIECESGRAKYEVFSLNSIREHRTEYQIVITIADYNEALKVKKVLSDMDIITVEELLVQNSCSIVEDNRQYIADYHDVVMEDYYKEAECENVLSIFWNKDSIFYDMFSNLKLDNVIELACGRGRHVEQYKQNAGKITLVDIVEKNILYCRERFSGENKVAYYVNNGHDLSELKSGIYSSVFSYDAMVHFEMIDIFEYLKETQRVLKWGGKALFHHSNNTEDYKITFSTGTSGRNYMSAQLFAYLANRAGLKVLQQRIIDWGQIKNLDCLTLLEKADENEKIKVLQFPIANSKGGITQYALQNWKYIDRSRFQFDFATMSKILDFGQSLEKEGCKIHYISCYAEENKEKFVDEFREILAKGNYDVVHLHTKQWKSFLIEQLAKEAGVKKIIIHAHSTGIDTLDTCQREKEIRLHNNVLGQLTQDIATDFWACSWKAADFIFGSKIPRQKIKILKNAIELSKYVYNPCIRKKYREELGILDSEFVIGNVGRMVFPKNQEFLLEIISEICKNSEDGGEHLRLLLVGAGEREQEYRNIVTENNLEERVIFAGQREDVSELLQAMDIFCLPSRFEGLPISLIEAQAAGLPCVVSDTITDEAVISANVIMRPLDLKLWEKEIIDLHLKGSERDRNVLLSSEYEINSQIKEIEWEYCQ